MENLEILLEQAIEASNQGDKDQAIRIYKNLLSEKRAIIKNIPLPESEHRFKDVVLNDGAPNGYRISHGEEYPVLDEIQHLSSSDYQTYSIKCKPISNAHFEDLQQRCWNSDIAIENWTTAVQFLCKQCSEGKPHEKHDHDLKTTVVEYRIALASKSQEAVSSVLQDWSEETGVEYYEYLYY